MLAHKKNPIFFVSVILIVGFLVTSLVSYYVALNQIRQNTIYKDLPLSVDSIYLDLRHELQKPIHISSFMSHNTFLHEWALKGEQDPSQIIQYLTEVKEHYQTLTSFFISAKTLNYYHPSGKELTLDRNNIDDDWFFRLENTSKPYEVNIDRDYLNSDLLTIFINYRVVDDDNNFIGVVGVGIEVDSAKKFIDKSSERFDHEIYFIDPMGDIQLRSSNSKNHYRSLHQYELSEDQIKNILLGKAGIYRYSRNGETRYISTRYIKGFNWVIMVEQGDDLNRKEINNALIINLLICLIIIFVVMLITNRSINGYQNELENAALKDKLTGLFNRYALDALFEKMLQRVNREQTGYCVLLIDIDHFKDFNDQYGHLIGDEVLKHIAKIIEGSFRTYDLVCRWGGEEFLVALEGTRVSDAKNMAEILRKKIENTPLHFAGLDLSVTVSIGVARYEEGEGYESTLNKADIALYASKASGRNKVMSEADDDDVKE